MQAKLYLNLGSPRLSLLTHLLLLQEWDSSLMFINVFKHLFFSYKTAGQTFGFGVTKKYAEILY